jgi:general stress protein YciG
MASRMADAARAGGQRVAGASREAIARATPAVQGVGRQAGAASAKGRDRLLDLLDLTNIGY